MSIYVGNLSYQVNDEDITGVFKYGNVKQVRVLMDRETGCPRGFCFVEMETEAIDALDGAEWMGRNLKVNKAKPCEDRGGGSGGGNRGFAAIIDFLVAVVTINFSRKGWA